MTIKSINRTKGLLSSVHSPQAITHSTKKNQSSQAVKMKLNLKNQEILLVESFNVHNSRTKILSDMLFSNDSPEQYYQKKISREI